MEDPIEYLSKLRRFTGHSPGAEQARDLIMSAGKDDRAMLLLTEACQRLDADKRSEAQQVVDDLVTIYLGYRVPL